MKNVLFTENGEVTLLTNVDDGSNKLVIDGNEIAYSYWVGTGTYTYGNITINKTSSDSLTSNLALKEIDDRVYAFVTSKAVKYVTFDDVYPVGSIYMSINPVNPATLFGGTWEAWGSGRVPIGVNTSDSDFNTVEKTGGSKTQSYTPSGSNSGGSVSGNALGVSEIPSHYHQLSRSNSGGGRTDWGLTGGGAHGGYVALVNGQTTTYLNTSSTGGSKSHAHGFTQPTFKGTQATLEKVQPYITCYMWKRTA